MPPTEKPPAGWMEESRRMGRRHNGTVHMFMIFWVKEPKSRGMTKRIDIPLLNIEQGNI